jgi:hypothetical protein
MNADTDPHYWFKCHLSDPNESAFTTMSIKVIFFCRKVTFDIVVQGQPFIKGLESLAKTVGCFYYLCFVAGVHYPKASF